MRLALEVPRSASGSSAVFGGVTKRERERECRKEGSEVGEGGGHSSLVWTQLWSSPVLFSLVQSHFSQHWPDRAPTFIT